MWANEKEKMLEEINELKTQRYEGDTIVKKLRTDLESSEKAYRELKHTYNDKLNSEKEKRNEFALRFV